MPTLSTSAGSYKGDNRSKQDQSGLYTHNRRGVEICRLYNQGKCGTKQAQGKCKAKRSHQCNRCLGPHQGSACPGGSKAA